MEYFAMITVNIRKQGGAAIMTIPADVLKILNLDIGSVLELDVSNKEFVARPAHTSMRKHYSLTELLKGTTSKELKAINKKTKWAREGKPMGREIA